MRYASGDFAEDHRISPNVSLTTAESSTLTARVRLGVDLGLFKRDPGTGLFVPDRRLNTFVGIDQGITVPLCAVPAPGSAVQRCSVSGVTLFDQPVALRYGVLELDFRLTLVGTLALDFTDKGLTTVRILTIGTRVEPKQLTLGGGAPATAVDTFSTRCGSADQHLLYALSNVQDRIGVGIGIDADARLQSITIKGVVDVFGIEVTVELHLPDVTLGRISSGRVSLGTVVLAGPPAPRSADLGVVPAVERCAA